VHHHHIASFDHLLPLSYLLGSHSAQPEKGTSSSSEDIIQARLYANPVPLVQLIRESVSFQAFSLHSPTQSGKILDVELIICNFGREFEFPEN
jgi:hypothetical protein